MLRAAGNSGSGGGERRVGFRLEFLSDPKARQMLDQLAKQVEALEKRFAAVGDKTQQQSKRMLTAWERGIANVGKEQEKAGASTKRWNDGMIRMGNQRIEQARTLARELEKQHRAQDLAQKQFIRAGKQLENHWDRSIAGATQLGRAIALTGVIGEQNMQKLLNTLIGVQIAMDAVHGGIGLVRGIQGMRGAAAARAAASARMAGSAAGQLGGAAAGGAGVVAAGKLGAAGAAGAPLALWGAAIVGAGAGLTSMWGTANDIRKYGFMGGAAPGSWREKIADAEASMGGWVLEKMGRAGELMAGPTPFFPGRAMLEARRSTIATEKAEQSSGRRAEMLSARMSLHDRGYLPLRETAMLQAAGRGRGMTEQMLAGSRAELQHAKSAEVQDRERIFDLAKQTLALERQAKMERLETNRIGLAGAREELALANDRLKLVRERGLSAAERFGRMDRGEQQRLRALVPRLLKGDKTLTREQIEQVEGAFGEFPGVRQAARGIFTERANAGGIQDILGPLGQRRDEGIAAAAQKVASVNVGLRSQVDVMLKGDLAGLAEEIITRLRPELESMAESASSEVREKVKEEIDKMKLQQRADQFRRRDAGLSVLGS